MINERTINVNRSGFIIFGAEVNWYPCQHSSLSESSLHCILHTLLINRKINSSSMVFSGLENWNFMFNLKPHLLLTG